MPPAHRPARSASAVAAAAVLAAIASTLALPACREPADPVRAALDGIAAAAGKRDAAALLERVSRDFRDAQGGGRPDAEGTVRRSLAAYESLSVTLSDVTIDRKEREAWAAFRADLSGTPARLGGLDAWLPRSSKWRFEVRLVEESGRWTVAWASWTREE